ncbi:ATP-binding protein [Natrarchaeobius sp. A-rgal3]|uniref:ATP-binding protein n=1 Tax=Natrarchaeobius versutus TaxID=1679078 RepID=UPI00350F2BC4
MDTKNVKIPPILENMNIAITLHDPESGDVLDVNEQLEELYGYSKEELQAMSVEDYTAPSTKFTQEKAIRRIRAAASGTPQRFEWQIERTNGEYRWVDVHLTQTSLDGDWYVLAEINDVTEYRAREQLLRLLNRVIRHNLRNDMNILVGYADRIKTAIENEQVEEEIETILNIAMDVGTLSESLNQIENVVKSNATQREPTNLRNVVQNHVAQAQNRHPSVDIETNLHTGVWVSADKSLEYAIENAIENAIEHNDQDSPEVTVTATEDFEHDQGRICIADNGPKIPDVEVAVLGDGSKADSTYHGSGVGLWIMKWCVDSLGGELAFETNEPRGNVVKIDLPKIRHSADD